MLTSSPCVQEQLESPAFQQWALQLHEPPTGHLHRKLWEWCYIAQALFERGMLQTGRRGLGFAVGKEPLAALFAAYGCEIVASDLDLASAKRAGWAEANMHASALEDLNQRGICPNDEFRQRVRFRVADMNRLPGDLTGYDFVWSSCAIEHLGSIRAGHRFMQGMTRCLRPGGVAVHTTELNVSSKRKTWSRGPTVLFRQLDLLNMKKLIESLGHDVAPLDFSTGSGPADHYVDQVPYTHAPHLKLQLGPYVATSMGIIVTASEQPGWVQRQWTRVHTSIA